MLGASHVYPCTADLPLFSCRSISVVCLILLSHQQCLLLLWMLQVMGVKDAAEYRHYSCPRDKCWLGPYPKGRWGVQPIKHCDCGLPYFQQVILPNGATEWEPTGVVSCTC